MRPFSNIMPNFAANLHLLVDSILSQKSCEFQYFFTESGWGLNNFV